MKTFLGKKNILALSIAVLAIVMFISAIENQKQEVINKLEQRSVLRDSIIAASYFDKGAEFEKLSQHDSAIYFFKSAGDLFYHAGYITQGIRAKIKTADNLRAKQATNEAKEIVLEAIADAKKNVAIDDILFAELYHSTGTVYRNLGNDKEAIRYFNKSINERIRINGPKDTMLSNTYNNLGNVLFYQGDVQQAFKYYRRALSLVKYKKNKTDRAVAIWNMNLAGVYLSFGDYNKANIYYTNALNIFKTIFDESDPGLARIYTNIGALQIHKGNFDEAMRNFTNAETIYLKHFDQNYHTLGIVYLNMGIIYQHLTTDYEKSLEYFNKALHIFSKTQHNNHPEIAKTLRNIGSIYMSLERFDLAITYFNRALDADPDAFMHIKTLKSLADIYTLTGNFPLANKYYKSALQKTNQEMPDNKELLGIIYDSYGSSLLTQNKPAEALKYHLKALEIRQSYYKKLMTTGEENRNTELHYDIAANYSYIAKAHYKMGNYDQAITFCQKALIANTVDFSSTDPDKNPDAKNKTLHVYNQSSILGQKASALFMLYRQKDQFDKIDGCFQSIDIAIELINQLSKNYDNSTEVSRIALNNQAKTHFNKAVDMASFMYNKTGQKKYLEKIYSYIERSKASSLLTLIQTGKAAKIAKIPGFILMLEKTLYSEISNYERLISDERQSGAMDHGKIEFWQNEIFSLKQLSYTLTDYLEEKYPTYYNLKYNNSIAGLHEVQKGLNKNNVIISYGLLDTSIAISVINSSEMIVKKIQYDTNFINDLKLFRSMLEEPQIKHHYKSDIYAFQQLAFSIYQKLLAPVQKSIQNKNIIIIPDNILGYIPVESLVSDTILHNECNSYKNLHFVIKNNPVSYAHSATILSALKYDNHHEQLKVLAFVPSYDKDDYNPEIATMLSDHHLYPLPGAKMEIDNISTILPTRVFKKDMATERNFREHASSYGILHLAMHSIINDQNPMYSQLVFSQEEDSVYDQILNTYEIYGLNLNARLAVLSACNTGYGKLQRGEGIISLTRGFSHAGVPTVLMTHWALEDKTSALLMKNYYHYISQQMPLDEALQSAKLQLLKKSDEIRAHPYFWSGFVSFGDNTPFQLEKQMKANSLWWILFPAALALFLLLLFGFLRLLMVRNHQNKSS